MFAGAEKLREETRLLWAEKFGVRIFEGYGATETSPALSTNSPMAYQPGSIGKLLPGIHYQLVPVEGINTGGRLFVKGPNIMKGYLLSDNPGKLIETTSSQGRGWYDTGDIITFDEQGFATICGRAKRFSKIGGEMVSLTSVEDLANTCWPDFNHAVIAIADPQKGEQLVLFTEHEKAARKALSTHAKKVGVGEINVPKKIVFCKDLPLLGTGKMDYKTLETMTASL